MADPYYLAFAPYSAPGRFDFWDYLGFFAVTLGAVRRAGGPGGLADAARRAAGDRRKSQGSPDSAGSAGCRDGCPARRSTAIPCSGASGIGRGRRDGRRSWSCWWAARPASPASSAPSRPGRTGWTSVRREPVELIVGVCGAILQLIFGLLMLSAVAPTSMAEERQRGSLDLLAATTLSTPTIVLGKWLATLRQVALLAIGPGLLGFALALAVKVPADAVPPGPRPGTTRNCPTG